MYTDSRDTEIALMKKLWRCENVVCPKCGKDTLTHLHRKAKKSDCDWKCPSCGEIYRTITMLKQLPINEKSVYEVVQNAGTNDRQ